MAECPEREIHISSGDQSEDSTNQKLQGNNARDKLLKLKEDIDRTKAEVSLRISEYRSQLDAKERSVQTELDYLYETLAESVEANVREQEQLHKAREESIHIISLNTLCVSLEEVVSTIDANIQEVRNKVVIPLGVNVLWQAEGLTELIENLCSIEKIEPVGSRGYDERKRPFWSGCKRGTGPGEIGTSDIFRFGLGLDIGSSQQIYVSDHWNNRILVFSKRGDFQREIGADILNRPYSVHVSRGSIYVSEWGNHRLTEFDLSGEKLRQVGSPALFNRPAGITTDSNNAVYVCDRNNNRVQKFNKQLEWQQSILQQFMSDPSDIKIRNGKLFVLAIYKSSKFQFSLFGSCNCIFVLSQENCQLLRALTDTHVKSGRFFCLDARSNFLISDSEGGCIVILSPEGQVISKLGGEMENSCTFCFHSKGLAVNENGIIVNVCDKNFNCLQMF